MVRAIVYINGTTRPGGAWESLRDIVFNLDERQFEPTIICSKPPAWTGQVRAVLAEPKQNGVRTVFVRMPMWRKARSLPRIPIAIVALRRAVRTLKASIVHANSIWDVPYALWCAKPLQVPVVAHVRTEIDQRLVKKYSLDKVDAVITTSLSSARVLSGFKRLESRVHHLPNGVNVDRFEPGLSGGTVRDQYGIAQDAVVFGAIGRIDRLKGLDLLVSAFSRLLIKRPDAKLLVVGDNTGKGSSFKDLLLKQVAMLGLSDAVVFTGQIQDVVQYLAAIDVLVMASRTEGFGRSAVEAMAMAKPVIASDVGALPEIVLDEQTGYIVGDGDVERLTERMIELALSKQKRTSLGQAGRQLVLRQFDLKVQVSRLQDLYRQQLEKRQG